MRQLWHCRRRSRRLWQCHTCRRQTSPVAATKLPLTDRCLAGHLLTQGKHGVSFLVLARPGGCEPELGLHGERQAVPGRTCHGLERKRLPRYFAEFRYPCNRRYDLEALVPRLAHASVRTTPMPYRLRTVAESRG